MLQFIHRLIRTLTLPNDAGPDDPAIVIGPDVPAPLRTRYQAAIIYRPAYPIGLNYQRYIGIADAFAPFAFVKVETGWFYVDSTDTDGWFYVDGEYWVDSGPSPTAEIRQVHGACGITGTVGAGVLPSFFNTITIAGTGATSELWTNQMSAVFTRNIQYMGFSLPRGPVLYFNSTANTGSIGTAGSTQNLGSGYTLTNGRVYKATIGGGVSTSTATGRMGTDLTITWSGGSGNFWGDAWFGPQVSTQSLPIHYSAIRRQMTGADRTVTATNLLVIANAGTVNWLGANNLNRYLIIEDVGSANDAQWANVPAWT